MNEYTFDELQADFAGEGRKGTASFTVEVTQGMMEAFRELSGDTNPLHTDEAFAKGRGFSGAVVFGMLTASFYSRLVGVYLPGKNCLFQSIEATFNKPVYVGDTLSVSARVVDVDERFQRVKIKAEIRRLAASNGDSTGSAISAAIINQQSNGDTLPLSSQDPKAQASANSFTSTKTGVKVGGAILWCGVLKDDHKGGSDGK